MSDSDEADVVDQLIQQTEECETDDEVLSLAKANPAYVAHILTAAIHNGGPNISEIRPFVEQAGLDVNLLSDAWYSDSRGPVTFLHSSLEFRHSNKVGQLLALGADPYADDDDPILNVLQGHNGNSNLDFEGCEETLRVLEPYLTRPRVLDQTFIDEECQCYLEKSPYLREFIAACEIEGLDSEERREWLRDRAAKAEAERLKALRNAGKKAKTEAKGMELARLHPPSDATHIMQGVWLGAGIVDVPGFLAGAGIPVDHVSTGFDNKCEEATTLLLTAIESRDEALIPTLLAMGADPFALPRANPLEVALCGRGYRTPYSTAECEATVRLLEPHLRPERRVVHGWVLDAVCGQLVRESDYLRRFLATCTRVDDDEAPYGTCNKIYYTGKAAGWDSCTFSS